MEAVGYQARSFPDATQQEQEWLKERINILSIKEKMILNGAEQSKPSKTAMEFINILCQTDHFEVYFPAENEYDLGVIIAEEENIRQGLKQFLDFQSLGKSFRDKHPGIFTDKGYTFMSIALEQVYDGSNLETLKDDVAVRLKIASESHEEGVWLQFPDYADLNRRCSEVQIALAILKAEDLHDCKLLDSRCILPCIKDISDQFDYLGDLVDASNNLGYVLAEQNQGMPNFFGHFMAALQYENCSRLDFALDISQNLGCYNFFPNEKNIAGYGRRMARENKIFRTGSIIESAFDYATYGEHMAQRCGMMLTEHGIIGRNGKEFFYEHSANPDMELGIVFY